MTDLIAKLEALRDGWLEEAGATDRIFSAAQKMDCAKALSNILREHEDTDKSPPESIRSGDIDALPSQRDALTALGFVAEAEDVISGLYHSAFRSRIATLRSYIENTKPPEKRDSPPEQAEALADVRLLESKLTEPCTTHPGYSGSIDVEAYRALENLRSYIQRAMPATPTWVTTAEITDSLRRNGYHEEIATELADWIAGLFQSLFDRGYRKGQAERWIPEAKAVPREHTEHEDCNCEEVGRAKGWNACRDAILAAAPRAGGGDAGDGSCR